jgi:sulfur carrier protein
VGGAVFAVALSQSVTGMKILVNGEGKKVDADATLADLLNDLGFERTARGIAVAVNGAVVPQPKWNKKELADGDSIEIIRAVQGG